MKKKIISVILAAVLLMTQIGVLAKDYSNYPQRFWDVPKDHWAFGYVSELVDKGVINGYEDGSFRPDDTVTRAEWAKIMVLAAGLPASDSNVYFYDMSDHWANIYVNTAKDYLAAYTDGTFKPDQSAVREDVTVSMVKLKGYDVSNVDYSYLSRFTDLNSISNSLKAYVAVAVEKELIDGFEDGTFRGQDTLTRAEAATLLWRAFQYGNDNKVVDVPAPTQTPTPEPTPTQKPEKEKPAETPKPTPKPEPAEESEPEPEPTEEPEPKPYKVDTLAKLNSSFVDYTTDGNNVYYADSDGIVKVNIKSKDKEEILNTKDLTIDTDEFTLDDFEISSICYDKYQDRLLVQGKYSTVNSAEKKNNSYLYEIKGNDTALITDYFSCKDYNIVGTLSNGDYVTRKGGIVDCNSFEGKEGIYGVMAEEVNDCIYYISEYWGDGAGYIIRYYLYEYDYVDRDKKLETRHGKVSYGISNRNLVIMDKYDNDISFYNFKGKQLNEITKNDCAVADKTSLDFGNACKELLITDNDDIIFYDESAKAIRIICKND